MVLVRDRRTEQREDAVAGRLHDVAVVAMHRLDHELQRRVDDRARLLGIEIRHQLGRALDVGEQRRDRLALAVDRFGRRTSVAGYFNLRFREGDGRMSIWFRSADRGAASLAESRSRFHRCFARRASQLQLRSALLRKTMRQPGCRSCTSSTASPSIPTVRRAAPWRLSGRRCRSLR